MIPKSSKVLTRGKNKNQGLKRWLSDSENIKWPEFGSEDPFQEAHNSCHSNSGLHKYHQHTRVQDSNKIKNKQNSLFYPLAPRSAPRWGSRKQLQAHEWGPLAAASGPCLVLQKLSGSVGGGCYWYYWNASKAVWTYVASITTPTPAGCKASVMATAICLVRRSWTVGCDRDGFKSQTQTTVSFFFVSRIFVILQNCGI